MSALSPRTRFRPVIRLFVSSTFSDMRHERNALQKDVFPILEQLCSRNGFQFQAIDLRWGVSSEAGLDHRTMRICFDELRRAQEISPKPNFLILLGNRYGWRPLPEEISVAEFEDLERAAALLAPTTDKAPAAVLRDWYRRDENAVPPVYLLQTRRQDLHDGRDYTQDAPWNEVQAVLWEIINHAMPPEHLQGRFDEAALAKGSPPAIVRFQASATEQEIWQGALRVPDAQEHVLAFFRQIGNVDEFAEPTQAERIKDFVDLEPSGSMDTALPAEQERLKEALRERLGGANVFETRSARLVPARDSQDRPITDVTTDHLAQLCRDVESRMTQIIQGQIEAYWNETAQDSTERSAQELKIEQDEHARFGHERGGADSFVGRETELQMIHDYLRNDSPWPLVVHGASGCGKTALLGRAAEDRRAEGAKGAVVMVRFIGVTPRSSEIRLLLGSLCQELRLRYPREEALPTDVAALREELHAQFRAATPEQPLVLFLDALDQLADADGGRLLSWIPRGDLPAHVKVVVSCLSDRSPDDPAGQPYAELRDRSLPAEHFINLDALSEAEAGRLLFDRWLPQAARTLSPKQRERIELRLASLECRQPIYLKLLFEEARLWPSYAEVGALGENVPALLTQLFARLGHPANHGPLLVERVLGYLAASRHGLAENEILEILFRDDEYKAALDDATEKTRHELPASATRIPIALWSRLRFDLAPYLSERAAPGTNVLTFYHRQVAEWVPDHLANETRQAWAPHPRLADYFRDLADPAKDQTWQGGSQRPFLEIAFHLQRAERWDDLCAYLTCFRCLDQRIRFGQVFAVVTDQRAAVGALPELAEEARRENERVEICRKYGEAMIIYARDRAAGSHPTLPEPPDAGDFTGTGSAYGEVSPRADRLRAIANFTADKATFLAAVPDDFLPLAANAAADGPLTDAAAALQALDMPWLHRSPRSPTPPLRPQCLQTLQGHSGSVESVALSPDGSRALSGSLDKALRLWDLHSGECLLTLQGHSRLVHSVALSTDGSRALSGSYDKALRLWDLHSGECLLTLQDHSNGVSSVALSPDGSRALSGSSDETLRLWDLHSGECLLTLQGHSGLVTSVALSPDGSRALSGSLDKTLRLWDLHSGECLLTLQGHSDGVSSVALSPDGSRALSGSPDKTLRLWDLQAGECLLTLQGHSGEVHSVALSPDGSLALSGSGDKTLRLWDLQAGECLLTLQGHSDLVTSVALSPDGSCALSGSYDKTLRLWDLHSGECLLTLQGHSNGVSRVALSPDGSRALSGSYDKTLRLWDLQAGECLLTLQGHSDLVTSVALSPDGSRALSGSKDGTLCLWNLQSGECLLTLQGHSGVHSVALSPDGSRALSGGYETLRLWDLHSGECLLTLQGHSRLVTSVALSPDGSRALSGSWDNTLCLWDLQSGECLLTLQGHSDTVYSVAFSPDGFRALSGSPDKTLRLWDLYSGECLAIYHAGAAISSVAIAQTEGRIVCGTEDGQMHFLTMRNFPGTAVSSGTNPLLPAPPAMDDAIPFDQAPQGGPNPLRSAPEKAKKSWWKLW